MDAVSADGNPNINACCADRANLEVKDGPRKVLGTHMGIPSKATATLRVCKVCGRKHHELNVDPVRIGVKGG